MRKSVILTVVAFGMLCAPAPGLAQEFVFTLDVPVNINAVFYTPNQVLRREAGGAYSLFFDGPAAGLTADVHISALALLQSGAFLFAADAPFTVGGATYQASDVVKHDGSAFSLFQSGSALSIPAGTVIDALARDGSGVLYYSFDVPTTVGEHTYLPNDVARLVGGSLAPFLSGASDLGLPADSDVVGFCAAPNGDYLFMFRAPTTISGTTYLPTQIVVLTDGAWGLYWSSGQPASGLIGTFSLPASPGAVPDGAGEPGTPLTVEKAGSNLVLSWGASCTTDANDYAVYSGAIGSWYSHSPAVCTTGGATSAAVTPGNGDEYYLIVPLNGTYEGSYGTASSGAQIPQGASPCHVYWGAAPCP